VAAPGEDLHFTTNRVNLFGGLNNVREELVPTLLLMRGIAEILINLFSENRIVNFELGKNVSNPFDWKLKLGLVHNSRGIVAKSTI